jgi:uncharacterized membrane protein
MARGTLLTFHLLGVVVWLGAGLYELFLDHEIQRARGTPAEVALARVYARYGPVVAAATLMVAATGVLQASLLGWGYFSVWWLGAKQLLMVLVLAILGALLPTFARMGRAVAAHPRRAGALRRSAGPFPTRSAVRPPDARRRAAGIAPRGLSARRVLRLNGGRPCVG